MENCKSMSIIYTEPLFLFHWEFIHWHGGPVISTKNDLPSITLVL